MCVFLSCSMSRSRLFANISENLGGPGTTRACGQANRFIGEFETKLNVNTCAYYNIKIADMWSSIRLELLEAVVGGFPTVFTAQFVISNAAS